MSILVVDDTPETLKMLQVILESAGYERILLAGSAQEAFQCLGIGDRSKDDADIELVFMDVVMPEIDGVEACRQIKTVDRFRDLPVIMVTAKTEAGFLDAAFAAGAHDYITKPVNRLELLTRMRSALRLKREIERRQAREKELEQALGEIKVLRGLLPICSYCKKIRDEKGRWHPVEGYIRDHSNADFTHGICPECLNKHYPTQ
jgi:phosphoserine phosphatase RsbU/P